MIQNHNENIKNDSEETSLYDLILNIRESWSYLLSKWVIILIAGITGSLLGVTYALTKKPIYIAELSFALQDEKSTGGISGAMSLASQFGVDIGASGGGEFSGDNLLELMKSRSMVEATLLTAVDINGKKETLADYYIDFNELRDGWESRPQLKNIHFFPGADPSKFTLKQDSLLGLFHSSITKTNLSVDKLDKKLSIVYIKVNSKSELFSKYFAEILEQNVSDFYIKTKIKKGAKNVGILQSQTDSVRKSLNSAIGDVASSVDANPSPNPLQQRLRVPSQRRQVDIQANTIILSELVKNLEMSKMSLLQQTPLIQVIDRPILPLEKQKVSKLISLLVGGILSGLLTVIILFGKKRYKKIMSVNQISN